MEAAPTILIETSSLGGNLPACRVLAEAGFQLVEAGTAAEALMQCRQCDIALIITGPPEDETGDHVMHSPHLEDIPILCFGLDPSCSARYPGLVSCFAAAPIGPELCALAEILIRTGRLCRLNAEKTREILLLTDKLQRQQQSMQQHSEFLNKLASRDGLTGLYNRRQLNKTLLREFERCIEQGIDLTLLILDIDYFNQLNKSAGRLFGDFVLNDFAARLTICTRPAGLCFRFSGEIFVVLLPGVGLPAARDTAESIRRNLAQKPFVSGSDERTVTISAGIVSLVEHQPDDPDEFITMAEQALFSAKSEGRDRALVYQPPGAAPRDSTGQNLGFLKETLTKILDKTRRSTIASLQLLAKDIAGGNNQHHISDVRTYVELLGRHLRLPDPIIHTFKNAITLHTSIRFLLHNEMISKQAPFSADDREVMDDFPYKLAEVTELFDYFSNERAILLYHGERYDGSGYPHGLKGGEIPLGARIFSIVDALAAMNSDRPHRPRLSSEDIVCELTDGAGSQFDPYLVIKVLEIIKSHRLLEIDPIRIDTSIETITTSFPDCSL